MKKNDLFEKNDIIVGWNKDHSGLVIYLPFQDNTVIYKLPDDTPNREVFISVVLHQLDLKIACEYLNLINDDQNSIVSEALFLAALNQCMKCFKYSKNRDKLIKEEVFINESRLLQCFSRFENIRDKHYMHDENGMLQPLATMLVSNKSNNNTSVFRPWVIWNRERLNFVQEAILLKEVIEYIINFVQKRIDSLAHNLALNFVQKMRSGANLELVESIVAASYDAGRNGREKQLENFPIQIIHMNNNL